MKSGRFVRRWLPVLPMLFVWLCPQSSRAAEIAVDIGHFDARPGVISASGQREFDVNRALAQELVQRLARSGITTHLIGDDGQMAVLTDRTLAAQDDKLFISLHHDSVQPGWMAQARQYSGFSIFISRLNPQLADSLACATEVGKQLRQAGFQPSTYHALPVDGENRPFADEANGVHYFDNLAVVRSARQAAILIEAGVIVNPDDEARTTNPEGRAKIAAAIATASQACLARLKPAAENVKNQTSDR